MNRLSTILQDKKVLALRKKGYKRIYIAVKLNLSLDQVRHAERRLRNTREEDLWVSATRGGHAINS